jgi:hypothetical protein
MVMGEYSVGGFWRERIACRRAGTLAEKNALSLCKTALDIQGGAGCVFGLKSALASAGAVEIRSHLEKICKKVAGGRWT